MSKVTSSVLQRNIKSVCDRAHHTPLIITRYGEPSLVLINIKQYQYLKHIEDIYEALSNQHYSKPIK